MSMLADGADVSLRAAARGLRPRERLTVSQWAARHRRLSDKVAAYPGPWRNERIPYLAAIMDALDPRHPAQLVVFVKSSQVGGSECGLNWIGRTMHLFPASFLALFPSEKDARKWVRTRLNSMIAETPELRRLIPLGRRSDQGNTLQEKHYPGGVLFTGSANIPTDVASVSVPFILLDELDRMPATLEDEGDPVELAKRRAATFTRRKVFEISTPTTDEKSRIWRDWLMSTQDRFYVPCPHCDHMQFLRWEHVKWPEGQPRAAGYLCESCAAFIEENAKTDMLASGQWRATYPEREEQVKGFHVSGLYTPKGLGDSWGEHAMAWEHARTSPAKVQVFFNTRLGEVVKSESQKLEWREIHSRREPYALRTIPPGVLMLTAGADVQHDRIEVQMLGFSRRGRVTVIDYEVLYGDPTREEVWSALDDWLARDLVNAWGVSMRLSCTIVDSGNWQHEVTNFTRSRRARRIYAGKGSRIASRQPIGKPTHVDVNWRGQTWQRGAEQYQIGVSVLKTTLYRWLKADAGAPEKPVLPTERHVRFSSDLSEEYFRQLAAERFDPKEGWVPTYDRNEALDTFVYALAAGMHHQVTVHKLREADWRRLEDLYEPAQPVAAREGSAAPGVAVGVAPGGFMPTAARVPRQ